MKAQGMSLQNKGIWLRQGSGNNIENIEFSEAISTDHNGAGIQMEQVDLTVKNCYFHHNENGILVNNLNTGSLTVEFSEFNLNGYGDGYSHNLYVGHIENLFFRFNYSHHCKIGHNLKYRAQNN